MKKVLLRWLISALSIFLTAKLVGYIHVSGFTVTLIAAFILGVVNAVIKPIIMILTLPINFITLGLFTFVINGFVLYLTAGLVPGFAISGLFGAIVGSIVLSLFNMLLNHIFDLD